MTSKELEELSDKLNQVIDKIEDSGLKYDKLNTLKNISYDFYSKSVDKEIEEWEEKH